jgi:hypothetical protein
MQTPNAKLIDWLRENNVYAAELLSEISLLSNLVRPKYDFLYGCASGIQVSEALNSAVKSGETAYGLDISKIQTSKKANAVFAQMYELGSSAGEIGKFRWTRYAAIADALDVFSYSISQGFISAAYLQIRSVIELSGNIALLCKDAENLTLDESSKLKISEWMISVVGASNKRGAGTRLDWLNLTKNGLRKGKSKSYKPNDNFQDKSAVDLMNGIDLVDKAVSGTRHAYDYLSEYAHPNVGVLSTRVKNAEHINLSNGFELQYRTYSSTAIGSVLVDGSLPWLIELLEITIDILKYLIVLDKQLEQVEKKLRVLSKKLVRTGIKTYPELFQSTFPCPCFSGKFVSSCCGRVVKLGVKSH